jgi:hypothetical protein
MLRGPADAHLSIANLPHQMLEVIIEEDATHRAKARKTSPCFGNWSRTSPDASHPEANHRKIRRGKNCLF